jgi:hypothetical protein
LAAAEALDAELEEALFPLAVAVFAALALGGFGEEFAAPLEAAPSEPATPFLGNGRPFITAAPLFLAAGLAAGLAVFVAVFLTTFFTGFATGFLLALLVGLLVDFFIGFTGFTGLAAFFGFADLPFFVAFAAFFFAVAMAEKGSPFFSIFRTLDRLNSVYPLRMLSNAQGLQAGASHRDYGIYLK